MRKFSPSNHLIKFVNKNICGRSDIGAAFTLAKQAIKLFVLNNQNIYDGKLVINTWLFITESPIGALQSQDSTVINVRYLGRLVDVECVNLCCSH